MARPALEKNKGKDKKVTSVRLDINDKINLIKKFGSVQNAIDFLVSRLRKK